MPLLPALPALTSLPSLAFRAAKTTSKAMTAYSALSIVLNSLASTSASPSSPLSTPSSSAPKPGSTTRVDHQKPNAFLDPLSNVTTKSATINYPGHVPISPLERAGLAVGSGVLGVLDTRRGDLIALLTETSSQSSLPHLHSLLTANPEGRAILRDRPLMSTTTIDFEKLKMLKRGTVGREYVEWAIGGGVGPDSREEVKHVDSPTLAYTLTRYRQTHDLYHTLFSLPPTLSHELTLKVIELSNMSLPVAFLSSVFGPLRLSSSRRDLWLRDWLSYALRVGEETKPLIGVYWEKRWEQGVGDLRRELGARRMDDRGVEGRWKGYGRVREKERDLRRKGEWVDEPEEW